MLLGVVIRIFYHYHQHRLQLRTRDRVPLCLSESLLSALSAALAHFVLLLKLLSPCLKIESVFNCRVMPNMGSFSGSLFVNVGF